jgi:hypothetical protein
MPRKFREEETARDSLSGTRKDIQLGLTLQFPVAPHPALSIEFGVAVICGLLGARLRTILLDLHPHEFCPTLGTRLLREGNMPFSHDFDYSLCLFLHCSSSV